VFIPGPGSLNAHAAVRGSNAMPVARELRNSMDVGEHAALRVELQQLGRLREGDPAVRVVHVVLERDLARLEIRHEETGRATIRSRTGS